MDHLVQFTISIDDAHIAQLVEKQAASVLSDEVIKVDKKTIGDGSYFGDGMSKQALGEVGKFLEAHKDYIIQETAKEIATRFMRTKKNKDAILEKLGEEDEQTG
jgi:hypothetical protein